MDRGCARPWYDRHADNYRCTPYPLSLRSKALLFLHLPSELAQQDGTPEAIPRDYRSWWEWCLPASTTLPFLQLTSVAIDPKKPFTYARTVH